MNATLPAEALVAAGPPVERRLLAIMLRLIAIASLAIMLAVIKLAAERGVHFIEMVFYRQAIALPLIVSFIWATKGLGSLRTDRLGSHATRTAAGLVGMMLNFGSVVLLPLAEATTIGFTAPIFATILSTLLLGERTGPHRWAAVLIGFCGVLVMVQPGNLHGPLPGSLMALGAAFMIALIAVLLRQLSRTEDSGTIVFWFTLLSLPPLGVGLLFYGQAHDAAAWGLLLLIGTLGGIGQLCLTASLKLAPVSVVMPMDYSSLLWATFFGWLFWDMLPTRATWLGAGLIVGSGLYIAWREQLRHKSRPSPLSTVAEE